MPSPESGPKATVPMRPSAIQKQVAEEEEAARKSDEEQELAERARETAEKRQEQRDREEGGETTPRAARGEADDSSP